MDGALVFFDRKNVGVTRFLPDFLLPGPLCYAADVDCIITCDSAFFLQAYK